MIAGDKRCEISRPFGLLNILPASDEITLPTVKKLYSPSTRQRKVSSHTKVSEVMKTVSKIVVFTGMSRGK
jgi:hypothetical protein